MLLIVEKLLCGRNLARTAGNLMNPSLPQIPYTIGNWVHAPLLAINCRQRHLHRHSWYLLLFNARDSYEPPVEISAWLYYQKSMVKQNYHRRYFWTDLVWPNVCGLCGQLLLIEKNLYDVKKETHAKDNPHVCLTWLVHCRHINSWHQSPSF